MRVIELALAQNQVEVPGHGLGGGLPPSRTEEGPGVIGIVGGVLEGVIGLEGARVAVCHAAGDGAGGPGPGGVASGLLWPMDICKGHHIELRLWSFLLCLLQLSASLW